MLTKACAWEIILTLYKTKDIKLGTKWKKSKVPTSKLLDKSKFVKFVNPAKSMLYSEAQIGTYSKAKVLKFGTLNTYPCFWYANN